MFFASAITHQHEDQNGNNHYNDGSNNK